MHQNKKYPCPCCGFYTYDKEANNTFQLCPICYWEDDGVQLDDPNYEGGANEESLNQAKNNFLKFKVSNLKFKEYIREPKIEEYPTNNLPDDFFST